MNKQFPQFGGFPTIPKMNARLEMHPKGVPGITPQWVIVQPNGMILEHTRSDTVDYCVTKYHMQKMREAIQKSVTIGKRSVGPKQWQSNEVIDFAANFATDCFLIIEKIMNEPIDGYNANMVGDPISHPVEPDEPPLQYSSRKDVLASIMKPDEES